MKKRANSFKKKHPGWEQVPFGHADKKMGVFLFDVLETKNQENHELMRAFYVQESTTATNPTSGGGILWFKANPRSKTTLEKQFRFSRHNTTNNGIVINNNDNDNDTQQNRVQAHTDGMHLRPPGYAAPLQQCQWLGSWSGCQDSAK